MTFKQVHLFSFYGMWGRQGTDLQLATFTQHIAKETGAATYSSPYDDNQALLFVPRINKIPEDEAVFLLGTSLGCNNIAAVAHQVGRTINGMFGFQASMYGLKGYAVNSNVRWAHLIYSYNPIPLPLLGAYCWPRGTINNARYVQTAHHIAHPGDYDAGDQAMFLREMKFIIAHG